MIGRIFVAAWFVVIVSPVVALGWQKTGSRTAQLTLRNGETHSAELLKIDSDKMFFRFDGKENVVDEIDFFSWGLTQDKVAGSVVFLKDGSRLIGQVLKIDDEKVSFRSRFWQMSEIDRSSVIAILLAPDANESSMDRWQFLLAKDPESDIDLIYLESGDLVNGKLIRLTRKSRENSSFGEFEIQTGSETIVLRKEKLKAIRFVATQLTPSGTMWISFREGSRISYKTVSFENGSCNVTTTSGLTLQTDPRFHSDSPLHSISSLHRWEEIQFLSDMKPYDYKFRPFVAGNWPYQLNRSVTGGQLRAGHGVWSKGIGMHSKSRLTFSLKKKYEAFHSELAIDSSAGEGGSVRCKVWLLRDGRWAIGWESKIIRGGQLPVPVRIDLKGASAIALDVDFADDGDTKDRLNWLAARLLPAKKDSKIE